MNLLTFYSCFQLPSSHVSGLLTRLSYELYQVNIQIFFIVLGNFLMFLLGTICAGYFLMTSDFVLTTFHYYAVLAEITLLLIIQAFASNCLVVLFLSTLALGLQNGITSSISNNSLRSTHFTGMITDVGLCIGEMMNKNFQHAYKLKIWMSSLSFYFIGGFVGSICIQYISDYVYIVNIVILIALLVNWKYLFNN